MTGTVTFTGKGCGPLTVRADDISGYMPHCAVVIDPAPGETFGILYLRGCSHDGIWVADTDENHAAALDAMRRCTTTA